MTPQTLPACIGCCSEFAFDTTPPLFEEAKVFFQNLGISLELVKGSPLHFRTRSKLAVRKEGIGLFKKGTHTVQPMKNCHAQHTILNEALQYFQKEFLKSGLTPYCEKTHKGDIRYIQCVVERKTNKVQLTLVLNEKKSLLKCTEWAKKCFQTPLFHSLWINVQSQKTNVIFSDEWHHIFGPECIWETICGIDIPFGPSHFGQANLEMFEKLLSDLGEKISPHQKVLETYAGVGCIGLSIAEKCTSLLLTEREKSSELYFRKAFEKRSLDIQKKIQFRVASSSETKEFLQEVNTVIVDPPRKGLEAEFLDSVIQSDVKQLIYISCGVPSFKRDAEKLLANGFKITFAKSYLFFPGTNHIELLTFFAR